MAIIEIDDENYEGDIQGTGRSDDITIDIETTDYAVEIYSGGGGDTVDADFEGLNPSGLLVTLSDPGGENDINITSRGEGALVSNSASQGIDWEGPLSDESNSVSLRAINDNGSAENSISLFGFGDVIRLRASAHLDGFEDGDEPAQAVNEALCGDGDDRVYARATASGEAEAFNVLEGGGGADSLRGVIRGDGYSELLGGQGDDQLSVRGGDGNTLEGNQGADTLIGGGGADRLIGGQDDDVLRGNGGADEFVFGAARNGERDRIADFRIGTDVMDVSGIDANVFRAGNQSFTFSGPDDWHGTGRVWVEDEAGTSRSIVYADNGRAVLEIALSDGRNVDAEDYSAGDFLL